MSKEVIHELKKLGVQKHKARSWWKKLSPEAKVLTKCSLGLVGLTACSAVVAPEILPNIIEVGAVTAGGMTAIAGTGGVYLTAEAISRTERWKKLKREAKKDIKKLREVI
jgi:hypothetical protein